MEKEEGLKAKKKDDPNELKVYSNGVGKFLNPTLKKEARYAEKYFFSYQGPRRGAYLKVEQHKMNRILAKVTAADFLVLLHLQWGNAKISSFLRVSGTLIESFGNH